ncbi:MAG TPA: D-2-hydroxyacid dehydrogenase [Spongiibacteraceae bacterium]|jgi:glycerate dehydrogenase|nr:D-2-hydroxyacid dehydrogenase [Spongiibacteraceae bacterium]HUH38851.1 D-2-hydroxyacid dehydrogenase [Spongiibacteraceae bacterium]
MQRGVILDYASLAPADLVLEGLLNCLPHWDIHETTAPDQVAARIAAAEVVLTNKVVLDAAALAAAPQLRLIAVMATGTNNIDLPAAARRGITVCNAVGYSTPSVVQHTFALLLALSTRLVDYHQAVRRGDWHRSPFFCLLDYPIEELAGRRLGLVGRGALGQAVAAVARAFGMEVRFAASLRRDAPPDPGRPPLAELLAWADVLSLHCPYSAETHALIDAAALDRMRPGALLINTARGGIVDEQALADALRSGHLGGAGIDVLATEPPRDGSSPLLAAGLPNLILSPHSAWGSRQSRQRLVDQLAQIVDGFVAGRVHNRVL